MRVRPELGEGVPQGCRFQGFKASVQVRPRTFAFLDSVVVKVLAPCRRGVAPITILYSTEAVKKNVRHCTVLFCTVLK